MKRTTYIMIGMLLAGLAMVCGIIFYAASGRTLWEDTFMVIGGERKTVQLPPSCRVVKLMQPPVAWKQKKEGQVEAERIFSFREVPLEVTQADSLPGSLSYAGGMDDFMSITTAGDTLLVVFSIPDEKLEPRFRNSTWIKLRSEGGMALRLPTGVQEVLVDMEGMETSFSGLDRDTLAFQVRDLVQLEHCRVERLSAQAQTLRFRSGTVRDLYLNLDQIWHWKVNVDSFHIDTEHLSGSRKYRNSVQAGECRRMRWTPTGDNASLSVEMKQAGEIVFGE